MWTWPRSGWRLSLACVSIVSIAASAAYLLSEASRDLRESIGIVAAVATAGLTALAAFKASEAAATSSRAAELATRALALHDAPSLTLDFAETPTGGVAVKVECDPPGSKYQVWWETPAGQQRFSGYRDRTRFGDPVDLTGIAAATDSQVVAVKLFYVVVHDASQRTWSVAPREHPIYLRRYHDDALKMDIASLLS